MALAAYCLWCALWNVAAGRKLFGLTDSTALARIVFAILAGLPLFFILEPWRAGCVIVLLWLWRLPGWGKYFAAIHGRDWKPDWTDIFALPVKAKATIGMAARMGLIVPAVIAAGNYWQALLFPLMGVAYYIGGLPRESKYSVMVAEAICGVIIGVMLWTAMT